MHIKRYRRILVAPPALMSALAATLLLATTTLAAPGNGAQVFKDSFCFDYEGSTICQSNMSITTETTTPSGNTLFTGNGRTSYIQTDPSGAVYEDSHTYHTHGVTMEDLLHEYGHFFTNTVVVEGVACTTRYAFHSVDGNIQFDRGTTCN